MPYLTAIYRNNVKPVLLDWITNSGAGKHVENVALSFANRAQDNLWAKKPWTNMVARVAVELVNGSYTFPSNFGRIVDMWADLAGTGTPSYSFFDGDNYERGYRLDSGFDKDTGYAPSITFHYAQQSNVYMRYQKTLSDFTDNADDGDEYRFFAPNLLLLEAQKINALEKGNVKEYQAISGMFKDVFDDFCNSTQWVNYDPGAYMKDRAGNEIATGNYSLSGEAIQPYSELPNSFIL